MGLSLEIKHVYSFKYGYLITADSLPCWYGFHWYGCNIRNDTYQGMSKWHEMVGVEKSNRYPVSKETPLGIPTPAICKASHRTSDKPHCKMRPTSGRLILPIKVPQRFHTICDFSVFWRILVKADSAICCYFFITSA